MPIELNRDDRGNLPRPAGGSRPPRGRDAPRALRA